MAITRVRAESSCIASPSRPVGAENSVTSCDSAETRVRGHRGDLVGKRSNRRFGGRGVRPAGGC
jgi:hypothetical protein